MECEFGYQGSNGAYLGHELSKSSFSFSGDDQSHYMGFVKVGDNKQTSFTAGDWGGVPPGIEQWASEVKRYVEIDAQIPDLWEELRREKEFLADIQHNDSSNTPFTSDERRQIVAELEAIKEQVKEQFDLTSEQTAHIDEWKDEVADASERVGRKDWRLLVYGTIVNLVVTDALPPEVARHILSLFIHIVAQLFGGGGPTGILA